MRCLVIKINRLNSQHNETDGIVEAAYKMLFHFIRNATQMI